MNRQSDLSIRKVVERNDLLESIAKLKATHIKLFELAVSCIDIEYPPKDNTIQMKKGDIYRLFEANSNNDSRRMRQAIKDLQQQTISIIKEVEPGKFQEDSISPIPTASWNNYNDIVNIRFNEDLMPYLIDLKANFTQYSILELQGLKSRYSLILYKYLIGLNNQYESYKYTTMRNKSQLEELKNPYIDMTSLRELTNTVNDYKRFDSFEARVLKKAKEEINESTNLQIDYEKVKKGRCYIGIRFYVIRKNIAKLPSEYQISNNQLTEGEKDRLYRNIIQNKYTELLLDTLLLNVRDIRSVDVVISLMPVYEKYKVLEGMRGFEGVKKHVNYVQAKQAPTHKENIVKYLDKAIVDYLHKVKIEEVSYEEDNRTI